MERLMELQEELMRRGSAAADEATRQRGTVQERYLHGRTEAYTDAATLLGEEIERLKAETGVPEQPATPDDAIGKAVWGTAVAPAEPAADGDNIVWGTSAPTPGPREGQQDQEPIHDETASSR